MGSVAVAPSFDVENPATGEVVESLPAATPAAVEAHFASLATAHSAWSATPLHERVRILSEFARRLREVERDRLAALLCAETGKPLTQTLEEIGNCARLFERYAASAMTQFGNAARLDSQEGMENDLLVTLRESFGPAAVIIPFNFPAEIFAHKVAPLLVTGNVSLVKPSPHAPLTVAELAAVLRQCGLPADALQVIHGGADVATSMVTNPHVRLISLTGGTEAGISVLQSSARHLPRVLLELGGNDPLIVFADADLETAVAAATSGRLLANGQCCCANKRLLVQREVHDEFLDLLIRGLEQCVIGNPLDAATELGPLISVAAAERARSQTSAAVAQGGRVVYGGGELERAFVAPTVLDDVPRGADVMRDDEIFAPVFPVTTFGAEDEAVAIANSSRYGLNAGMFTRDVQRGLRVASQLETGTAVINGTSLFHPDVAPFGGRKMTGNSREGLTIGLDEVTQVKTVVVRNAFA